MKFGITTLFFLVFIGALLFDGIIPEAISWLCILIIFLFDNRQNKKIIGRDLYNKSIIYILFYVTLFLLHFVLFDYHNKDLIRFYGYTKCICAPAIVFIVFPGICKEKVLIKIFFVLMIFFNVLYGKAALVMGPDEVEYQLGSMNGCSGISVILFPVAVYYWRYLTKHLSERLLLLIYIATTFFVVYVSESLTTMTLLVLLTLVLFLFSKTIKPFLKRNTKKVCLVLVLGLLIITILIAIKAIPLDPSDLRIRVAIWLKAYNSFISQDTMNMLFGSFDCLVQLESKTLQAHNVFVDILLIHGVLGLLFFVVSCVYILNKLLKIKNKQDFYISLVIGSFFIICFMHPFYTGVFIYQIICVSSILFLINRDVKYE